MHQKLFPDPFSILLNNPKQLLYPRNSFKNKILFRGLSKSVKNVNYIFLSNLVSFNGQNYQKQKRPSDHSLFRLQNKFRKNSLISYALSDQVWWCNIKWFFSYSKNYICKFMQANSCYHELFHPCLSFSIWKAWNGSEKKNLNISRNKKHFS